MNWKKCFISGVASFMVSSFLISPKILNAANAANNGNHTGNSTTHVMSTDNSVDTAPGIENVSRRSTDLHAAMVHVAEGESYLVQMRQRGDAQEILSAKRSLHESERYFVELLATSSGVSIAVIEETHTAGVSLAQIGYDLRLVNYPTSRLYLTENHLDMSELTMDGVIGSRDSYRRNNYYSDANHHNYYDGNGYTGGGMGGMH